MMEPKGSALRVPKRGECFDLLDRGYGWPSRS